MGDYRSRSSVTFSLSGLLRRKFRKKREKIHYGVTTAVTFMHLSNTQLAHCKIMKIINTLP